MIDMITLTQAAVQKELGSGAVPEDFECAMRSWDLTEEWPCLSMYPAALVDSERWLIRRKVAARDVTAQLNTYTCNNFLGRWPVGTAAVVVAASAEEAEAMLQERLVAMGLPQPAWHTLLLLPISQDVPSVNILCDGDY